MPLLYAVISRKNVILAKHAMQVGNFAEVTDLILSKIDTRNKKMSYSSDSYMFHYIMTDCGLTFLCIADESFRRSTAFAFLAAIETKLIAQFGENRCRSVSVPMALHYEFSTVIAAEMKRTNLAEDQNKLMVAEDGAGPSSDPTDKVQRVRNEVDRVKDIMVENIETIVERGERLELLVDKTDQLSQHSVAFKQTTRTLQRRMWWQNTKLKIGVAVGFIVGIYIIVSISCGGLAWPKCVG